MTKIKTRKYLIFFWLTILSFVAFLYVFLFLTSIGMLGALPSFDELENPKTNLATQIYTSDNKILGTYFKENRTNADFNEISPNVVKALVATEDERYYDHSGIDFRGTMRALMFMGTKGGASTITQQLAKMLFHDPSSNFILRVRQKLQEWIIAIRLEKHYTKDEIMTMYLNKFDFLYQAVGIRSAARVYFSKEPAELNLQESAILVGMLKNPSRYNPRKFEDQALVRRNVVLGQMHRSGLLSETELDSISLLPIELHYQSVDHKEGAAPYFREILRGKLTKILNSKDKNGDYIYTKPNGDKYNLYEDGLKIYTTIDSRMQNYAEIAVKKHLGEELQGIFSKKLSRLKNPPFQDLSKEEADNILNAAVRRTQRYRVLKGQECVNCGRRGKNLQKEVLDGQEMYVCQASDCGFASRVVPEDSIGIIFNIPTKMEVFTWKGKTDTILSPMDSIKYYKSFLQAGFMAMNPHSGHIKAWVGGPDFEHFSFDHVVQSKRQVGSTFKPLVYALAIQEGYSPCMELPNVKTCFEMPDNQPLWCPKNSDGEYGCNVSLKYALANSLNTITAWIMKQFGPQAVVDFAKQMGIESPLLPVPALCLGVADLSVYELVGANATFVNYGVWTEPIFIERIEDNKGNVIEAFYPKRRKAISEQTAYAMVNLMKGVVDGVYNECRGDQGVKQEASGRRKSLYYTSGTGVRIRHGGRDYGGIKYPMAGKTGTTQNNSDGWFMGLTPELVSGVWVGAEDRSVRFNDTYYGQGANMALPIYGYFMNQVYNDKSINLSTADFPEPQGGHKINLDCIKNDQNNNKNGDFEQFDNEVDFSK